MNDIVISAQNVSKRFKLYKDIIFDPIKEYLLFWKREDYYREFWAVKDVSFDIERGEIVGIIGPNGAGKTTLLKMIAGLLEVDRGSIKINGKVTALLTLGLGFHLEFTGRENIFYGGMLLGMSKKEILRKMDEIIEFAEVGDYIDRPLRTYSTGMRARLIFATSMSIDPDILIVDEALATGDSYFVQKCSQRIGKICESGATILFVSHNLVQIQDICQRVIFMAKGQLLNDGEPGQMVRAYQDWIFENEGKAILSMNDEGLQMVGGTGEFVITEASLKNAIREDTTVFHSGEEMRIELKYKVRGADIKRIHLFVGFIEESSKRFVAEVFTRHFIDMQMDGFNTGCQGIELDNSNIVYVTIKPLCLFNGRYSLWIMVYESETLKVLCEYRNVKPFFVGVKASATRRDMVCTLPVKEWGRGS